MEQSRKVQIVAILALMIATMSLLVGFSSLNAQLDIGGTAAVKSAEWDVHFGDISNITSSNEYYAKFTTQPALVDGNSSAISFAALMSQPGQSISFNVDVVNECTIDAKVTEIAVTGITGYEKYITWNVTGIEKDEVIAAGDTISDVKVTLSYNFAEDDTLLNQDVSLNDLNVRISFIQSTN